MKGGEGISGARVERLSGECVLTVVLHATFKNKRVSHRFKTVLNNLFSKELYSEKESTENLW